MKFTEDQTEGKNTVIKNSNFPYDQHEFMESRTCLTDLSETSKYLTLALDEDYGKDEIYLD